ncbi:unnamed protein product [Parajaminaea phylloscopi]
MVRWSRSLAALWLAAFAPAQATANTAILNFERPLCSRSWSGEAASALSRDWQTLVPSSDPHLFTVHTHNDGTPVDRWVVLDFQGSSRASYTLRASYPANHPLDVDLDVVHPLELLGSHGTSGDAPLQPCPIAFLRLRAARSPKTTLIPPATGDRGRRAGALGRIASAISGLSELYMGPLAAVELARTEEAGDPTPVHLTLEPLVFGVAPWGVCTGVVPVILAAVLLVAPLLARSLGSWLDDVAAADTTHARAKTA